MQGEISATDACKSMAKSRGVCACMQEQAHAKPNTTKERKRMRKG
jgi:hypothetical protein